jgi:hypothetical protein
MPRLRDPLPGRAMVPRLLTALPTPRRWRYLPMLRGDDHRRRTHPNSRPELTLAGGQHVHPLLKKRPRFEGKLTHQNRGSMMIDFDPGAPPSVECDKGPPIAIARHFAALPPIAPEHRDLFWYD